jgi:hypothetical protein
MRKIMAVLLIFCGCLFSQTPQLTQVPPKPTCTPILPNGSCTDLWRTYNQAFAQRQLEEIQLYVDRQKELASAAATAPLEQQIADLTKLSGDQQAQLKRMHQQMQADAVAALQAKQAAREEGIRDGIAIGAIGTLILFLVSFVFRRLFSSFTIVKKSQSASA